MPYSNGVFRPDFDAPDVKMADWVNMPQSDTPDFSGLVQGLKKKMTPTTKGVDGGFSVPPISPMDHEMGHIDPSTASKGFGGGKSL